MIVIKKSLFTFIILFVTPVNASDYYENVCEEFKNDSLKKTLMIENIKMRKSQLIENYALNKDQGGNYKKNKKKAKKKSDVQNYKLLLDLINHEDFCKLSDHSIIKLILDLDYALKTEGSRSDIYEVLITARAVLKTHTLSKKVDQAKLPVNIYDPIRKKSFTKKELFKLISEGKDISLYDPVPNGPFWERRGISDITVKKLMGAQKLYSGIEIEMPKEGKFKEIRKTQTKPKIDFISTVNGIKREFKLKVGAEIHSEITAGALATMLGFYTDISKYVRNFKILLDEDYGINEFKLDWYSYFKKYEYEEYVLEEGIDKSGAEYIIFKEGLIETKPKELNRVGAWAWGTNNHEAYLETRAMSVFNMWIANNDIKESGNNKFVVKEIKGKEIPNVFKYQHDLGFSFGYFYREKPNDFLWKIIKENTADQIEFYYRSFQDNSGFNHMSFWDAKWIVRKIALLSREQIKQAVVLGGWPDDVAKLIVEKLISRRNDLVKNFNLINEVPNLKVDTLITTGSLLNGSLTTNQFEGSTQNYKSEIYEVVDPFLEKMRSLAIKSAIAGVKYFDKLVIDGESLNIRPDILAEVQVSIDRKITTNPEITSKEDRYIVHDFVKVRYGLGAGKVLRGKVNYVKNFQLVYPVSSVKEGEFHNGFIFNALLPRDIRQGKLPDRYVLIVEDGLEGEGEVLLDIPNFPIDFSYSRALGKLSKTIISKTELNYTVFRDISPYTSIAKSVYADLSLFRIPLWHSPGVEGLLGRNIYKVDLSSKKEAKLNALDLLLANGNIELIKNESKTDTISSNYVTKVDETDIFGLYESRNFRRTDDMIIKNSDGKKKTEYQLKIDHYALWSFLGDGEVQSNGFSFHGIKEDGVIKSPRLHAEFKITDKATTTEEFDSYLKFIDELSLSKDFLSFKPSLHTRNNNWGHLKSSVSIFYDKKTIKKILSLEFKDFVDVLSVHTKLPRNFWKKRRTYRFGAHRNSTPFKYNELRQKLHKFLRKIEDANKLKNNEIKYTALADALDRIVWMEGNQFDVVFFKVLHELIGRKNLILKASVQMPGSVENTLPMKIKLFNSINRKSYKKKKIKDFEYDEGFQIWESFMLNTSPTIMQGM